MAAPAGRACGGTTGGRTGTPAGQPCKEARMFKDVPLLLLAATVATYWGTVALLILHKRVRHGRSSGLLPRHVYERRLWALIVPVVFAWIALPILAGGGRVAWLRLPAWAHE